MCCILELTFCIYETNSCILFIASKSTRNSAVIVSYIQIKEIPHKNMINTAIITVLTGSGETR